MLITTFISSKSSTIKPNPFLIPLKTLTNIISKSKDSPITFTNSSNLLSKLAATISYNHLPLSNLFQPLTNFSIASKTFYLISLYPHLQTPNSQTPFSTILQ
eukprot:Phypoly_transcript_21978.p1 GENE.Phypoly_transcript_21978~~Phypoly_transcript_21978.p1  ORF type:complete len:102 (-),score=9.57 Phypoly_transcript_21978:7-312(-)